MTENEADLTDSEFFSRFEAGTLHQFPHEAHLRAAYLTIQARGEEGAPTRVMDGLRGLAKNFGVPKFLLHRTRTTAWVRIIAAREGGSAEFATFLRSNLDLLRRDLLDSYYSRARLNSLRSRVTFLQPDLRPLSETPTAA